MKLILLFVISIFFISCTNRNEKIVVPNNEPYSISFEPKESFLKYRNNLLYYTNGEYGNILFSIGYDFKRRKIYESGSRIYKIDFINDTLLLIEEHTTKLSCLNLSENKIEWTSSENMYDEFLLYRNDILVRGGIHGFVILGIPDFKIIYEDNIISRLDGGLKIKICNNKIFILNITFNNNYYIYEFTLKNNIIINKTTHRINNNDIIQEVYCVENNVYYSSDHTLYNSVLDSIGDWGPIVYIQKLSDSLFYCEDKRNINIYLANGKIKKKLNNSYVANSFILENGFVVNERLNQRNMKLISKDLNIRNIYLNKSEKLAYFDNEFLLIYRSTENSGYYSVIRKAWQ